MRGRMLSVGQNEGDIEVDAILSDLSVLNDHLLLLDPRALYIRQFLGGPGDALLYSVLEALVRTGDDLGDSRNGHDKLLVFVNSATNQRNVTAPHGKSSDGGSKFGTNLRFLLCLRMHRDLNMELIFPVKDGASAWLMSLKAECLREAGVISEGKKQVILARASKFLAGDCTGGPVA